MPLTKGQAALAARNLRLAQWFARRRCRGTLDPDEVESRCVAGLLMAAQSFRPRTDADPFGPWAVLWMRGELSSLKMRSRPKGYRSRRPNKKCPAAPAITPLAPDLDVPRDDPTFGGVDLRDELDALMDAARLDDADRALLWRRYRLRQTGLEIAADLGVCEATVVAKINRLLARLRAAAAG